MDNKLALLKPNYSTLLYEARLELVLAIRASRRVSKRVVETDENGEPIVKVRKVNTKKRAPTKADARSLLAAMTPELAAELLAMLEQEGEK